MSFSFHKRILGLSFLAGLLLFSYTNCAGPLSSSNDPFEQSSQGVQSDRLQLSPQAKALNWRQRLNFEASGGKEPYYYSLAAGGGTLDAHTGVFIAPGYDSTVVVQVRDADGELAQATAYVSFTTSGALTLSTNPTNIKIGDQVTLTASGGTAPYTYQVVAGVGNMVNGKYNATAFGSATIGIVDSKGVQNSVTISVSAVQATETVQIYKWYNTDYKKTYYETTSTASKGWTSRGAAFKLLKYAYNSTVPVTRCFIPPVNGGAGTHFISTSGSCGSYMVQKILGYAYTSKVTGSVALLNCFHSKNVDYVATTVASECTSNGYAKQPLSFGFVPTK